MSSTLSSRRHLKPEETRKTKDLSRLADRLKHRLECRGYSSAWYDFQPCIWKGKLISMCVHCFLCAELLQSARGKARFRSLEEAMSLSSCCAWAKVVECSCWYTGCAAVFCCQLPLRCMRTRSTISVWERAGTVTGFSHLSWSQKSRPSCWTMFIAFTQWHGDLRSSSEILQPNCRVTLVVYDYAGKENDVSGRFVIGSTALFVLQFFSLHTPDTTNEASRNYLMSRKTQMYTMESACLIYFWSHIILHTF